MEQSHLPSSATGETDFAQGAPMDTSLLPRSFQQPHLAGFDNEVDASRLDSTLQDDAAATDARRPNSAMSQSNTLTPSRGGTLKKKQSLSRKGSLKRSTSTKSIGAGDTRSLRLADREKRAGAESDEMNSAFFTPVPTNGNPTEILANRFQAWRKVLKDLITYFRDIQKSYESRSKSLLTISNAVNNTSPSSMFLIEGGISDATQILRDYYKQSLAEGNKAKNIEEDVIVQLTGLRSDLQQKIKEIKNLSGDFKNAVDKETEATRKAVRGLQEALGVLDSASSGKGDPYLVKLSVDKQLERQIEEENYLHRAFLNLESSGRELESIVVGEIQKAYNTYAGILKREADEAYDAADRLRSGPIAMAKDHEWEIFVENNENFVDPRLPVRRVEHIHYPGKDHPAALEVRAGMLERKSKYLKSYTPGWYVLSPTHLHEFKSADRLSTQTPIMSLYLQEQKLGSRSGDDSSSHKFMLKGRQTGSLHRGHAWVFRAESRDTMLAWYEDIKSLTEKTGEERNAFVRQHARSASGGSQKPASVSSDGVMDEDEADQVPYSATASQVSKPMPQQDQLLKRPQPGGRFPSDINVNRDLQVPLSPSSRASSDDHDIVAAAVALPGSDSRYGQSDEPVQSEKNTTASGGIPGGVSRTASHRDNHIPTAQQLEYIDSQGKPGVHGSTQQIPAQQASSPPVLVYDETASRALPTGVSRNSSHYDTYIPIAQTSEYNNLPVHEGPYASTQQTSTQQASTQGDSTRPGAEYDDQPVQAQGLSSGGSGAVSYGSPQSQQQSAPASRSLPHEPIRHDSKYGEWIGPAAAGVGGAAAGVAATEGFQHHQQTDRIEHDRPQEQVVQQLESAPLDLDSSNSAPAKLPGGNGSESYSSTGGLGIGESSKAGSSSTIPTPKGNATRNDSGEGFLASGDQSSGDANMAPPTQARSAGQSSDGMSSGEAEPPRPVTSSHDTLLRTVSHMHVPGEYPPTPAAL